MLKDHRVIYQNQAFRMHHQLVRKMYNLHQIHIEQFRRCLETYKKIYFNCQATEV